MQKKTDKNTDEYLQNTTQKKLNIEQSEFNRQLL